MKNCLDSKKELINQDLYQELVLLYLKESPTCMCDIT